MSHSQAAALGGLPRLSLGTVAMAVVGLALYQLTSLELGPRAHDFQVNLALDGPLVQEVVQPLEKADVVVGHVSLALRFTPPPLVPIGIWPTFSTASAASTVTMGGTKPVTATKIGTTPVTATNPPAPLPIIGRCRGRWTGSWSATSPSNGSDRGVTVSLCWGAVVRG